MPRKKLKNTNKKLIKFLTALDIHELLISMFLNSFNLKNMFKE